ncbi:hypothetical protein GPECTOR_28g742 [Gonium pectorale]|uniref:Uncharacterized protein n=1 Tax=Gonium pectorale TaxID=33097 RepID=A0A150GET0_GONPE|nr:hypothetical protein GPECTOR_28g742 [Gonium pectorale]|eukprot:KXZ48336.1 hypothetical protein GPECTOR_28g742 [Gonium pectorale]
MIRCQEATTWRACRPPLRDDRPPGLDILQLYALADAQPNTNCSGDPDPPAAGGGGAASSTDPDLPALMLRSLAGCMQRTRARPPGGLARSLAGAPAGGGGAAGATTTITTSAAAVATGSGSTGSGSAGGAAGSGCRSPGGAAPAPIAAHAIKLNVGSWRQSPRLTLKGYVSVPEYLALVARKGLAEQAGPLEMYETRHA